MYLSSRLPFLTYLGRRKGMIRMLKENVNSEWLFRKTRQVIYFVRFSYHVV